MDLDDFPDLTNLPQYHDETKAFGGHPRFRQDQLGNKPEG